jgi:preprotein translocase subunit SecG
MYLLMPVLLQNSGAVVLNLSLLMTDAYSAVCAYFFFQQKISIIYVFAFIIIAIGLVLYSHTPKAPKTSKTPNDASNCDANDNNDQYGQYGSIQSDNGDDGAV